MKRYERIADKLK